MNAEETCPECGAKWESGVTCEDYFHQMLFWENEDPERGVVHHLMVLGYMLQHPSLYSPDGLAYSLQLLVDFVEGGIDPIQVRVQSRSWVDSSRRKWKIRGKPGSQGAYQHPISWSIVAQDVVNSGVVQYIASVEQWARSILSDLRASGNLN